MDPTHGLQRLHWAMVKTFQENAPVLQVLATAPCAVTPVSARQKASS